MTIHEKLNRLFDGRLIKTQEALASKMGVSKSTLNRWFSGANVPSLKEALQFARIYAVPLEYLADDAIEEVPGAAQPADREAAIRAMIAAIGPEEALRRLGLSVVPRGPEMPGKASVSAAKPKPKPKPNPKPQPKRPPKRGVGKGRDRA